MSRRREYNATELRHANKLIVVMAVALVGVVISIVLVLTDQMWLAAAAWVAAATLGFLALRSGLRLHARVEARWRREDTP